jgi:uncharacterized membrane protein
MIFYNAHFVASSEKVNNCESIDKASKFAYIQHRIIILIRSAKHFANQFFLSHMICKVSIIFNLLRRRSQSAIPIVTGCSMCRSRTTHVVFNS